MILFNDFLIHKFLNFINLYDFLCGLIFVKRFEIFYVKRYIKNKLLLLLLLFNSPLTDFKYRPFAIFQISRSKGR